MMDEKIIQLAFFNESPTRISSQININKLEELQEILKLLSVIYLCKNCIS